MEGNVEEAKKKYDEAASLAKVVGFEEGKENSNDALKRLEKMWNLGK